MYAGWYDSVVQKYIINFLVNPLKGLIFLKSVDVAKSVKDSNLLLNMLHCKVDEKLERLMFSK